MTAPKKLSLADYARANPAKAGTKCWLCGIPQRAEVEAAVAAGVPKSTVRRWLNEVEGYGTEATDNKIDNHFRNHVDQSSAG